VPFVEATVASWNAVSLELSVANLTDLNPDTIDLTTGDVNKNAFDTVLIVGETTGASWTSRSVTQKPKPFDDAADIQEEFNRIKVYDPDDANPFGFV